MEVILLEKVKNLGNLGDTVNVKPGFGRNFLIPQEKAVFATPENIEIFKKRKSELEKKAAKTLADAEKRAEKLQDLTITITAQASDEGRLYGSVGVNEIREALAEKTITVDRREIILTEGPIHFIGEHQVEIHLHSDVIAKLQVQVVNVKAAS